MVKDAEDKKVADVKRLKRKTDEKTQKATDACSSAGTAQETASGKLSDLEQKAKEWEERLAAHNEMKAKKAKGKQMWEELKNAQKGLPVGKNKQSPEEKKKELEANEKIEKSGSSTSLAKEILETPTKPVVEKPKKPPPMLTFEDRGHPLMKFASLLG